MDNLTIEGFDYGIHSTVDQYSLTFRDLTLKNQNRFGIWNRGQSLFIHNLTSRQSGLVPVLDARGGMIAIVKGRFEGRGKAAVRTERAKVYVRDLQARGYSRALVTDKGATRSAVEEWSTEEPMTLFKRSGPMEHLAAVYETVNRFGGYPLEDPDGG